MSLHSQHRYEESNQSDMSSFSGIYFLLRIIIYFNETISKRILNFNPHFAQGFIISFSALIFVLSRPYKWAYMNTINCILLFHTATFFHVIESTSSLNCRPPIFIPVIHVIHFYMHDSPLAGYRITQGIFRKYFSCRSSSQCLTSLKKARMKVHGRFVSQKITRDLHIMES